ncbi:MAG: transcription-repair coupling factor [Bacteroidetes bacterium]|nr:transcription-repair coupling factor [Bacteroidota bacterium]
MNPIFPDVSRGTSKQASVLLSKQPITIDWSSYLSFLIADFYSKIPGRCLVVVPEDFRIPALVEDLETVNPDLFVLHYEEQDWERLYSEETELRLISERIETLRILQDRDKAVVFLSAKSILTKVPPPANFNREKLHLRAGKSISFESLQHNLEHFGFTREDVVSRPGDFTIRGGIVDIFSFGSENPVRIEFWGDDIDSLRYFDVKTQRSIETIEKTTIYPNFNRPKSLLAQVCLLEYLQPDDWVLYLDKVGCWKRIEEFDPEQVRRKTGNNQSFSSPEELLVYEDLVSVASIEIKEQLNEGVVPQSRLGIDEASFPVRIRDYQNQGYRIWVGVDQDAQWDRIQNYLKKDENPVQIELLKPSFHEGWLDTENKQLILSEHLIFSRFRRIQRRHQIKINTGNRIENPLDLRRGDYVVHEDHGIGKFVGLTKIKVGNKLTEVIKIEYTSGDTLFVNVKKIDKIQKYSSRDGASPALAKIGSPDWQKRKESTKAKIREIARDLILLYSKRKKKPGFKFAQDTPWQSELEASFMYEDTPDQAKTMISVKEDMEDAHPMDRLVCGDVGFGKTEIAVRAAFKAIQDGKQVAILVPTTILAQQHYTTFTSRMAQFPVRINVLSRFKTAKEAKEIKESMTDGTLDLVIGTTSLMAGDIKFKDLGLLIIDEEHRFGVKDKERIKALKVNVDVLAMSATPIPRSMQLSMMGARDISIIATPPVNRMPVEVTLQPFNEQKIKDIINEEMKRNGQIFFIHNRVKSIYSIANYLSRLMPRMRIQVAHGQMNPKELEEIIVGFINHEIDLLCSTNIVESGVDIPNANTIIINRADRFGLSELYQLKGRVGRSNRKGHCHLLIPPIDMIKRDAVRRLLTIEEFTELGSGFNVAMRDLDLRGAGNILGAEQSGFINNIGVELYHSILEETVLELKEVEFSNLFKKEKRLFLTKDVVVETPFNAQIPDDYVESIQERFDWYKRFSQARKLETVSDLQIELVDRYGPVNDETISLISETRLKLLGEKIGCTKIQISANSMELVFPGKDHVFYRESYFEQLLKQLGSLKQKYQFREVKGILTLSITISDFAGLESEKWYLKLEDILEHLVLV